MQSDQAETTVKSPGKFLHFCFCFMPLSLFVLLAAGVYLRGWWLLMPIVFLQVGVPILDYITGWQDTVKFEKKDFSAFEIFLLHWNTRLYAICYVTAIVCFAINIRHFNPIEIGLLIGCCSLL